MTITSVFTQAFFRPSFSPATDLPDLNGKVAVVTGASTGLGKETARELARKGAHVFCVGRTVEKTKAAIDEIIKETGNEKVEFIQGDFMDLKSVIFSSKLNRLRRRLANSWKRISLYIYW